MSGRRRSARALLAALALVACGGGSAPPTVDVTGRWVGRIASTDDTGAPVYGTYTMTLVLAQSGSGVTGDYSADISIGGSCVGGVADDRLQLTIRTSECRGQLALTGIVHQSPGVPATMDVGYAGTTDCAGGRYGNGTLTKQ